jgi:hypothetical protein
MHRKRGPGYVTMSAPFYPPSGLLNFLMSVAGRMSLREAARHLKLDNIDKAFCCISSAPASCSNMHGSVQCISKYRCRHRSWSEVQAESWFGAGKALIVVFVYSGLGWVITCAVKYKLLRSAMAADAGAAVGGPGCCALCCSWSVDRAIEIAFRACFVLTCLCLVCLVAFSVVALVTCK